MQVALSRCTKYSHNTCYLSTKTESSSKGWFQSPEIMPLLGVFTTGKNYWSSIFGMTHNHWHWGVGGNRPTHRKKHSSKHRDVSRISHMNWTEIPLNFTVNFCIWTFFGFILAELTNTWIHIITLVFYTTPLHGGTKAHCRRPWGKGSLRDREPVSHSFPEWPLHGERI